MPMHFYVSDETKIDRDRRLGSLIFFRFYYDVPFDIMQTNEN